MGRTADLAQDIITMVKEYNGCIRALQSSNDSLVNENRYYRDKYNQLKEQINEYEHKLEIITDVIAKYMDHSEQGTLYISSIWNFDTDSDYMKIIKALEIPLSIDEVKE